MKNEEGPRSCDAEANFLRPCEDAGEESDTRKSQLQQAKPQKKSRSLWSHQERVLAETRTLRDGGATRILVQAPTGSGKTCVAGELIKVALAAGLRVIFVVPALELINQATRDFRRQGIKGLGIIQADHPGTDLSKPVQIASVQTLLRRDIPEAALVIIDEAHRWYDFYGRWLAKPEWKEVPFIGFTATPWTRGLGKYWKDFIIGATTIELIQAGILCVTVFAAEHPDLTKVKTVAGDYHEGQLSEAVNRPTLVANIIETWQAKGEDRQTFCFCVDRSHAKAVQAEFATAGVTAGYLDCASTRVEREAVRKAFAAKKIRVVCNVGVLTTGIDWDVHAIILARPTKSRILFTQIVGRGLRRANGKDHCLILDHADNHAALGFVTDPAPSTLDDGEGPRHDAREAGTPLPRNAPPASS